MTAADVLTRARAACDVPVRYRLGQPGRVIPKGATEAVLPAECDCSGFVCYCLNMERFQWIVDAHGFRHIIWLDTTVIAADAKFHERWFEQCAPAPGCLIVYPDRGGKQGHVGIVSEVKAGKVTKVIHCSRGNERTGNAIQETGPEVFVKGGAVTVWCKAVSRA